MGEFLVFDQVTKRFGDTVAVDDVSIAIDAGEIFSLLGPSGCGKTTLLRLVAGFIVPDAGRVLLDGQDISHLPPEKRPVNTVFQNYALFPHLNVRDNVAFGPKMAKRGSAQVSRDVDAMLDLVGLRDYAKRMPSEMSGGQRQRVAIARALINRPRVLLLDEPLAALDLKLRQRLLVELDTIHDEVGTTFLYVTHDQGEAMGLSDRIAVMWEGRVEQIGSPIAIYEAPDNSFVAAFIGDTNFIRGKVSSVIDHEYSVLDAKGLGDVVVYNDRNIAVGETVDLSLRPEKIALTRTGAAAADNGKTNRLSGIVEDIIYLGSLSRYWIRVGELLFAAEMPHSHYLLDEKPPTWGDEVWLSWHADDGYLLDEFDETDKELLSLAAEEP